MNKPLIPRRIAYADLASRISFSINEWLAGYKMKLPPSLVPLLKWCNRHYKEHGKKDTVSDFYFDDLFPRFKLMTRTEREAVLLQLPSGFYRAEFRGYHMIANGEMEVIKGRGYKIEDYSI